MRVFLLCCAFAALASASHAEPRDFLGFRLLVLDSQLARWETRNLTYAFVTAPMTFKSTRNCGAMVAPSSMLARSGVPFARFRTEVAAAFRMWEGVANLAFRETGDPRAADILIGAQAEPQGRAFTNVALKNGAAPGTKVIEKSLICLNPAMPWKIGFDGDLGVYDLRFTVAHEIGHAIGLDHPSPSGQLMSYRYDERHKTLQPGDVAGVTALYGGRAPGRREASRSGPAFPLTGLGRGSGSPPALALGAAQGRTGNPPRQAR